LPSFFFKATSAALPSIDVSFATLDEYCHTHIESSLAHTCVEHTSAY
jgi:hypothetical protein